MKTISIIFACACVSLGAVMFSGCGTASPQSIAITTIGALEKTVYDADKGYLTLVVTGNLPTNDVPKVNLAFNSFQKAAVLATVAASNSTNAFAPSSLMDDADAFVNLISTIEGKK